MNPESPLLVSEVPLQYRALSTGAVVSLVLGLSSGIMVPIALSNPSMCIVMGALPLTGLIVGAVALKNVRQMSDILTGRLLALAGMVLSALFLTGGLALASYVYATEAPDGYDRIGFSDLRCDDDQRRAGHVVPPDLMKYDGQKVFIKGYMRPSSTRFQLAQFLLVRDNNECCFGKNDPAYYDRVQVTLQDKLRADYSTRLFRLAGTLRILPEAARMGPEYAVFSLEGDYLK